MYRVMYIQKNRSYTPLIPTGVLLHETETPGVTASHRYHYLNGAYRGDSTHAVVDWRGVLQLVPFSEQVWHAAPEQNQNYIGIELCRPLSYDPDKFAAVWQFATTLCADLWQRFSLTAMEDGGLPVQEGVQDYFRQYGKTIEEFRRTVESCRAGNFGKDAIMIYNDTHSLPSWAKPTVLKLLEKGWLCANAQGDLHLSEEMLRLLVLHDRAGLYNGTEKS